MEKQKEGSGREKGPFVMVAEYKLYGTDISYDSIYFSYLKKKGGGDRSANQKPCCRDLLVPLAYTKAWYFLLD